MDSYNRWNNTHSSQLPETPTHGYNEYPLHITSQFSTPYSTQYNLDQQFGDPQFYPTGLESHADAARPPLQALGQYQAGNSMQGTASYSVPDMDFSSQPGDMSEDDGNFFSNIKHAKEAAKAQDDVKTSMKTGAKSGTKSSLKMVGQDDADTDMKCDVKYDAKSGAKSGMKSSSKMVGQNNVETDVKSDTKTPRMHKPKGNNATAKENKQRSTAKDSKHKKGTRSKLGILNRRDVEASDDEIAELDAKTIEDALVVELSKSGSVKFRAKFAEPRTGPSVRF